MSKDTAEVSDLGLAAALVCKGVRLLGTRQDEDGRVHFIFMNNVYTERDIQSYWSDHCMVNAREYFDTTKSLKNRIYSER